MCGSITDGDVRRHLLRNGNLSDSVKSMMNSTPVYCYLDERELAYKNMSSHFVRSIPILNREKQIVEIVFYDEKVNVEKK